jgi:hypothetical protein
MPTSRELSHRWVAYQFDRWQRRIRGLVTKRFYVDRDRDTGSSILVAGTARSGTSWLGELISSQAPIRIISSQAPIRILFEPFNPNTVNAFAEFSYFHYQRPCEENPALAAYSRRVFSGAIRHAWIDREVGHLLPTYRVVKDIRANLFLKWLHLHFPEVPLVFVLRHPCAVVLSRLELGWATDTDIQPFLGQEKLVQDFLGDKLDLIQQARTAEAKHAVVWCISNLIPLNHLKPGEAHGLFYEHLCVQPEVEIPALFGAIGRSYTSSVFHRMQRPSRTSTTASAVTWGTDKVRRWQSTLAASQVRDILRIVDGFGLTHLYDDSLMPRVTQPWVMPSVG